MNPQWHIAFCNVTVTEYAGISYKEYYASPANTLEAQLKAKAYVERQYGVGEFLNICIDTPSATFASFLGMPIIEPASDELPYIDTQKPLIHTAKDADALRMGNPKTSGLMARRWEAWQYYHSEKHDVRLGGHGGAILSTAHEISNGEIFMWLAEEDPAALQVLAFLTDADLMLRRFDEDLCGATKSAYTGDDFSGLLSPAMYRRFAIPHYQRIYAGRSDRFMHSELSCAEHLRIAKDLLDITCFHGAGCRNLTPHEMHEIMGSDFWMQITPQEMLDLSPCEISEKIKEYANSGAGYVQIYPGRSTPDENLKAAIEAADRECSGGRVGKYL